MAKSDAIFITIGATFFLVGILAFIFEPFSELLDELLGWIGESDSIGNVVVLILGFFFLVLGFASERYR